MQHILRNVGRGSAYSTGSLEECTGSAVPTAVHVYTTTGIAKEWRRKTGISQADNSEYLLHETKEAKSLQYVKISSGLETA